MLGNILSDACCKLFDGVFGEDNCSICSAINIVLVQDKAH